MPPFLARGRWSFTQANHQQRTRITCFPETQQRSRNLMWIRKDNEARQIYLVLLYTGTGFSYHDHPRNLNRLVTSGSTPETGFAVNHRATQFTVRGGMHVPHNHGHTQTPSHLHSYIIKLYLYVCVNAFLCTILLTTTRVSAQKSRPIS